MASNQSPSTTQNSGQREMMFCHECHDEWYRDQRGIICPECGSEFTEIVSLIHDAFSSALQGSDSSDSTYLVCALLTHHEQIEDDNDPRDNGMFDHDHDGSDDDVSMPSLEDLPPRHPLHPLSDHNPWADADDPDDSDISTMRFQNVGPGRYHVSATIHRTVSPVALGGRGGGPNTIGAFTSLLGNLLQGARPPGQSPGQPPNQTGEGQGSESRSGQDGQPHVHRFTYSGGARLHPRDANNPEPRLEPVDDINNVLAGLFAALGEPAGARQGGPGHAHGFDEMPMNPLMGLFAAMTGGQHGDYVHSQEALDRIISQLMEQTATSNAPGPASQEAINSLPRKIITEDMLGAEHRAECSICMDEVNIGAEVTELPCKHWFHHQCVAAWLSEHDTCPHCRKGISKPGENPANSSSGGNASSRADPTSSMPGAFGVAGEGSAQNPFFVPGTVPPSAASNFNNSSNTQPQSQTGPNEGSNSGEYTNGGIGGRIRRGLFGP